jgi:hypothetical protein
MSVSAALVLQLLELREENARLRDRLRQFEGPPDSRKSSGTGEAAAAAAQHGGGGGVPAHVSM